MTDPARPLVLTSTADPRSGWGSMAYHLSRGLQQRGRAPITLLPRGDQGPPDLDTRSVLPPWRPSFGRRRHHVAWHEVVGRRLGPGLRHVVVEYPYAITATAGRPSSPVVVSGQGTYLIAPLERPADAAPFRRALLRADLVTVPSRYTADRLQAAVPELLDVRIVPNPVDTTWLREPTSVDARAAVGVGAGAPFVLSVAALKARKGVDVLLRAFVPVAAARPDVVLVVVAAGDASEVRRLAQQLGILDSVRFPGSVDGDSLRALYRECEAFVLLPRVVGAAFEGFGLVYLEAGAFGKAVVGTRSGGVPDAVLEGRTGLLVPEEDHAAAGQAILRLLADPELRARLGAAGRARAEELSWSSYVDTFTEAYDELGARASARVARP